MKTHPIWHGVRLRQLATGADPDAPPRLVSLPAGWEDSAAAALAALAPGDGPVALPAAAAAWIEPLNARAPAPVPGIRPLAERLHLLLLRRQAAPEAAVWQRRSDLPVRFVLNLPGFLDPLGGFDTAGFVAAIDTVAAALALLASGQEAPDGGVPERREPDRADLRGVEPGAPSVGVADLAGLLAALGIAYASTAARDVARALAAILRGRIGPSSGSGFAAFPGLAALPATTVVPGLSEAARAASATTPPGRQAIVAVAAPGAAEALLGVEIGGIAPEFSPLSVGGGLT
ncbi:MAG: hypothetical protein ACREFY_07305, partial [Acetobacteraceae bacterium]